MLSYCNHRLYDTALAIFFVPESVFLYFLFYRVESAARAVIDAYKLGKSGSIWLSNADKPAKDITKYHTEAYEILTKPFLE